MKTNLKFVLPVVSSLLIAQLAPAASVNLLDFTAFESPDTYFLGDWELTSDAGGTNLARPTFLQGAGAYAFEGGSNDASASVFHFYSAALDVTGLTLLEISGSRLASNTAATFTVSLYDAFNVGAFAVFATSDFAAPGFTTSTAALTFSAGFDASSLLSIQISGNDVGGTDVLSVSLDNLAATTPPAAVPEAMSTLVGLVLACGAFAVTKARKFHGASPSRRGRSSSMVESKPIHSGCANIGSDHSP